MPRERGRNLSNPPGPPLCFENPPAKPNFRSCTAVWRSDLKRTIRRRSCSIIRDTFVSNICAIAHVERHGEPTEATYTSQPRHDAAKSEPLEKTLAQKQLVIEKHVKMATAKSSSDLTCGEGMSVCTPRAGAFESVAVLGV